MKEADTPPLISPLVRQYSLKVQEEAADDTLTQSLGAAIQKHDDNERQARLQLSEWRSWLRLGEVPVSDAILKPLEDERKKVVDMWESFGYLFPISGASRLTSTNIPTIQTLQKAVNDAQDEWKAKGETQFGKAKDRLFDFLEMMNDHSYLFKFIPAGDKYISLITGVVSSVVQASVNYKKIADGFSLALVELSSDLKYVDKKTQLWDSPDMRRLVVQLYVKVFQFLCHSMSWFQKKRNRFKTAFNKNFYDEKVAKMVQSIQLTVARIQNEAAHLAETQIQHISSQVKSVDGRIEQVSEQMKQMNHLLSLQAVGNENHDDDQRIIDGKLQIVSDLLGSLCLRTLQAVEQHAAHNVSSNTKGGVEITYSELAYAEQIEDETADALSGSDTDEPCTRYEIQKFIQARAIYIEDGRKEMTDALRGISSSLLPEEVLADIRKWIETTTSKMIWVEGVSSAQYGSIISLVAMQARLSNQEAAIISLLYSIISQLSRLVPTEFQGSTEFYQRQFELLDGSFGSGTTALKIIEALLVHAPPSLIWAIDGLQMAENRHTIPVLDGLVRILRDQENQRISKVCFTTDGNSRLLMRATKVNEQIDASRMAQGRPGGSFKGAGDIYLL